MSAEKKIEMTCGGSSIVMDGEEEREDFKAMELYLESPFNVDVDIMPPSEVEKLFQAFAEERKRELPQFTPDGIPITLENKFDDAIYNYLYEYWKEQSGEYDPKKDVIPESEMNKMHPKTKNEKKFEQWLLQQYGMTKKEQRGYTLEGNLDSLWEIFSAADMVLLAKALPNIGKNLVQLGKDVLENGIQFDTSLGIVAGGGEIWNLKNAVDDVAEEAIEKTVKREVVGETVEKTVKTEVSEEAVENTAKKEMADTAKDLSQKTIKIESKIITNIIAGKNFKDHYIRHKGLLEHVTGKKYPKYKQSNNGQEFLNDLQDLINNGMLKYEGLGTIKKGFDPMKIYRGNGLTLIVKTNGEFVTLLKMGEGMDLGIQFLK